MKKIISITIWIVIIAGILILVSFMEAEHKKATCKSLEVTIDYRDTEPLITAEDIKKQIYIACDTLIGKKLSDINPVHVENMVNEIDFIENAQVYTTLTGKMNIHIIQRKPILRIINTANESFYVGQTGVVMPVNPGFSSRVPVANGNIKHRYADTLNLKSLNEESLLKKLYLLASYINKNDFLKAQIEQIYVTKNYEFELVPKVGRQLIIFGDINNMEKKFDKLMVFYKQGMNKAGWDKYKTINLKFENQVVCSKK